mmetsp:Transcript_28293/g.41061  ORF Transcript_28293/g.41061 Transcript_28293/m.41061 type:complete len:233 (+) Transcript_28293:192-890(+)
MNRSNQFFRPIRSNSIMSNNSNDDNVSAAEETNCLLMLPLLSCCSNNIFGCHDNNSNILDDDDYEDDMPPLIAHGNSGGPTRRPIQLQPRSLQERDEQDRVYFHSSISNGNIQNSNDNVRDESTFHSLRNIKRVETGEQQRTLCPSTPPPTSSSSSLQGLSEQDLNMTNEDDIPLFLPLPWNHKRLRSFTESEKHRKKVQSAIIADLSNQPIVHYHPKKKTSRRHSHVNAAA